MSRIQTQFHVFVLHVRSGCSPPNPSTNQKTSSISIQNTTNCNPLSWQCFILIWFSPFILLLRCYYYYIAIFWFFSPLPLLLLLLLLKNIMTVIYIQNLLLLFLLAPLFNAGDQGCVGYMIPYDAMNNRRVTHPLAYKL